MYRLLSCMLALAASQVTGAPDDGLLVHLRFDEAAGAVAEDASGNGLAGEVTAERVESPSGRAVRMDGAAGHVVRVPLPEDRRFGTGSWTVSLWLKPIELTIDDRQNQRRVFDYGPFPEATMVMDLTGDGRISVYLCHTTPDGGTVSVGGGSSVPISIGEWAHVALVCDRENRTLSAYVNGYSGGGAEIRADFAADYVLGEAFSLGSSWHNYWGDMDEVKVYRRALGKAEIKAEFRKLKDAFGAAESPAALEAERRETMGEAFALANRAWAARDFAAVRRACGTVVALADAPPHFRSYAHLRLALSHRTEGNRRAARAEYGKIAAEEAYPYVHRYDAEECIREIDREAAGLPPHDPEASRSRVTPVETFAAEVWMAPDGDDAGDGSRRRPFATLQRSRDAVRALRARGVTGAVAVRILPGEYRVTDTLALTAEDSGSEDAPVVYRAEEPGKAVFYGGERLSGFVPVSDPAVLERLPAEGRGKVMQCDLRGRGITDYGELRVRGFGQPPSPPTLELFFNGQPMTLSRWPNEGFVGIRQLVEPGSKGEGIPSVIEYISDRHERWAQAEDLWLFGYFRYLWADATIKVAKIDTQSKFITTAEAYSYGGGMDPGQGIQYYAFNLLEEIDRPGEWYLDRGRGVLYFYPPSDPANAEIEIGMLSVPMVTAEGVSDLRIEGLTLDLARYNGIVVNDSTRVLVAGCTVSRMAGNGITIAGGSRNSLIGCDVHTIGRRATEVIGGDRETLTPGGHLVENCRIHFFGRIDRTYTPAIQLEGVGNRVAHNLMYNCPSSVMRIEGNDHLIEYNEVHSAVRESDDQGAMELFRNATYRGVIVRYNRLYHVGKDRPGAAVHGQAAIRFDDAISDMVVYGNIFHRAANGNFGGVQMNSGRDNIMDNNIFADCKQGISGGWYPGNSVWRMIREGNKPDDFYTNDLYLSRYPRIATWLDEPAVNNVWRNVFYRCGTVATGNRGNLDMLENGVFPEEDPGFVDAANGDFRLKPDAKLFETVAFRPIPVESIGLYEDPYRASWPVLTKPVDMPDWRK